MTLPEAFIEDIKPYLPAQELDEFVHALTEDDSTCCIRQNRAKSTEKRGVPIGWNQEDGAYLNERPNFTLDPLMHAGCYYVQEASSQFVTHAVRSLIDKPVTALDLCAAPGGKSTAMLSVLPQGSQLVSNEIDRRRARILAENVTKWGLPNVSVTCNAPNDFRKLTHLFDLILTDVPCSGEGMFRKDEGAIKEWNPQKVSHCVELQREILQAIWTTLKPGGILIYSTCTFNVHEDEEMLRYICEDLGAEAIEIPIDSSWHIHPPLLGERPCYRFMPHYTRGEGLFMAIVRKNGISNADTNYRTKEDKHNKDKKREKCGDNRKQPLIDLKKLIPSLLSQIDCEASIVTTPEGILRAIPKSHETLYSALLSQNLFILQSGVEMGSIKGRDIIPAHALALSTVRNESAFPTIELDLETALSYLRHEAIVLPEGTPTGYVIVEYQGHSLGFVKNLGNRSNNLYPQEWRIRYL